MTGFVPTSLLKYLLCVFVLWLGQSTLALASCLSSIASERLINYCLVEHARLAPISLREGKLIDFRLKKEGYTQGLGLPGRVRSFSFDPSIAPILGYEHNVNGGNPDKPLVLGSLEFFGEPELTRKSGFVAGLQASLSGRYIITGGRYIDYAAGVSFAHSPAHNASLKKRHARLCSKNHIKNLWHIDGCVDTFYEEKELVDDRQHALSISTNKLYTSSKLNYHQLSFGVKRLFKEGFFQNQFTVGLQTIHSNGWHSSLETTIGQHVDEELVTRSAISAALSMPINGREVNFKSSFKHASGSRLLGFDRIENTWALSTSINLNRNIQLTVGYEETDSTIGYFDSSSPVVSVSFTPLRF